MCQLTELAKSHVQTRFHATEPMVAPTETMRRLVEEWIKDKGTPTHSYVLERREMVDSNQALAAYTGFENTIQLLRFMDRTLMLSCHDFIAVYARQTAANDEGSGAPRLPVIAKI